MRALELGQKWAGQQGSTWPGQHPQHPTTGLRGSVVRLDASQTHSFLPDAMIQCTAHGVGTHLSSLMSSLSSGCFTVGPSLHTSGTGPARPSLSLPHKLWLWPPYWLGDWACIQQWGQQARPELSAIPKGTAPILSLGNRGQPEVSLFQVGPHTHTCAHTHTDTHTPM